MAYRTLRLGHRHLLKKVPAMRKLVEVVLVCALWACTAHAQSMLAGDAAKGSKKYDQFERPEVCKSCHADFYQQWRQAMMSQAYNHHWDEIEYFDLAVAHAEKVPDLKPVADGCNGCHAHLAFLAGDVPPPRPAANSRANEGVSCDFCHTVRGYEGEVPNNFSYISTPGRTKYGSKPGRTIPSPRDPILEAS